MPNNEQDIKAVGIVNTTGTEEIQGIFEVATQAETNTGTDDTRVVTPLKLKNFKGITGFFLDAKGEFGTGGGWADSGFIGDLPVLLFSNVSTEKAVYMFFASQRGVFTDVDPIVLFGVYSTGAPVVTTGDDVRWQLEVSYIAQGELATKTPDETLLQTQTLTELTADTRQPILAFTLDKSLISDDDVIMIVLSRLGTDGADTYADDVAIGQSGIRLETTIFNP
jgi:hypothetical protein